MPIVFPEMAAFVAFAAAVGAFILYRTEAMWLRPLVLALQHPHGSWWKRLLLKGAAAVAVATLYVEKHVRLALSEFAAGGLHMLTRGFAGLAACFHFTYRELGLVAHDIADALAYLRHHTIPHLIHAAVAPVARLAHSAYAEALAAERFAKALEKRFLRGIDRLRKSLEAWTLTRLHGIDRLIGRLASRVRAAEHAITVTIPHELGAIRLRLTRLEKLLGIGALTAAIIRVLARRFPWLFCRNVNALGRAICGMNPDALNSLIGLLIGVFVFSDLRRSARLAEDALGVVTTVVWDAAALVDLAGNALERPAGRFTID
jgi:hypothetical protein